LLAEVQGPVERRAVVVNQLGVRDDFADAVNHLCDLANVRLLGFDPQQVSTVLQAGDTVEDNTVDTGAFAEAEQAGGQALRLEQLAVCLDNHVAVLDVVSAVDVLTVQERVVLVAQVARLVGDRDLLGQASAKAVDTGSDINGVTVQLEERVTYCDVISE